MTTTLEWHTPKDKMPDDDSEVIFVTTRFGNSSYWVGRHTTTGWHEIHFSFNESDILCWAELPDLTGLTNE